MWTFTLPQLIAEILPDTLGCCPLSKFAVDFVQLLHRSIKSILFQSCRPTENQWPSNFYLCSSCCLFRKSVCTQSKSWLCLVPPPRLLMRDAGALLTQQPLHTRIDRFSKLIMLIHQHFIRPVRGSWEDNTAWRGCDERASLLTD